MSAECSRQRNIRPQQHYVDCVVFPRCGEDLDPAFSSLGMRDAGCDEKVVAKVERAEAALQPDAMDDRHILASDVMAASRLP